MASKSDDKNFGTFKRPSDGSLIQASSIDDRVSFVHRGWEEVKPASKSALADAEAATTA